MSVNSDFRELLSLFNAYQVRYLVIGGYAVILYTEPRFTKDLDLWISTKAENAAAVYEALLAFGAPLEGLAAADFAQEGHFYQMGIPPVRVDIMMSIKGLTFEAAWPRRVEADFGGVPVHFLAKADLITAKVASGRPQDLIDAALLSQSGQRDEETS